MNPYHALFAILVSLATAAGGILWGITQRTWNRPQGNGTAIARLKKEIAELKNENARLSPQSDDRAAPTTAPPKKQGATEAELLDLASRIALTRQTPFRDPISFREVNPEELYQANKNETLGQFPERMREPMTLSFLLLGFLPPDATLHQAWLDHTNLFLPTHTDPQRNEILLQEQFALDDPFNGLSFAHSIINALQWQHRGATDIALRPANDFDGALAMAALRSGDRSYHANVLFGADPASPVNPLLDQQITSSANAPGILPDVLSFPDLDGLKFFNAAKGKRSLAALYLNPPTCTAHILHPEKYLADPPYAPRDVRWRQLTVNDIEPYWDNTTGELAIRSFLSQHIDINESAKIAAGWDGDAFVYYLDANGPHLLWKTLWQNTEAADGFFKCMKTVAPAAFGLEAERKTTDTGTQLAYGAPFPFILEKHDEDQVSLIRANSGKWVSALQDMNREATTKRVEP